MFSQINPSLRLAQFHMLEDDLAIIYNKLPSAGLIGKTNLKWWAKSNQPMIDSVIEEGKPLGTAWKSYSISTMY